jgi:hypothetical protein
MSHKILKGLWCHISVVNLHSPPENKGGNEKRNVRAELKEVFEKFSYVPNAYFLLEFRAKLAIYGIFKLRIINDNIHEIVMIMVTEHYTLPHPKCNVE